MHDRIFKRRVRVQLEKTKIAPPIIDCLVNETPVDQRMLLIKSLSNQKKLDAFLDKFFTARAEEAERAERNKVT